MSKSRVATDIGGTFTDIVVFEGSKSDLRFGKVLSTPNRSIDAIMAGMASADADFKSTELFLHGSTLAINTIIQRDGAKAALVTTKGFRDIYEIGRINRPDAYNLFFRKHIPLIKRSSRYEISERMTVNGEVQTPLDEAALRELAMHIRDEGYQAVAVMFLHSYANSTHEKRAKEILKENLPGVFVTASHELGQEYREFERSSTVAANAYIGPKVSNYLDGIVAEQKRKEFDGAFVVVQSNGGGLDCEHAKEQCVRILESGPAAGVIGAEAVCGMLNINSAVAFDMGGTTAKAAVIQDGRAIVSGSATIGPRGASLPVQIPMINISEVGTGGGSIARVVDGESLRVGPMSAGAVPGPVCYGRAGTEPTVTDANLVLGRLDPAQFLGGAMRLDEARARSAIKDRIADPLGLSVATAAEGILQIAVTAMSHAVKAVTVERGLDVRNFDLIAYGGAGPLHATLIAHELRMRRVIVPRAPGHFSAIGMLLSDLRYDRVKTIFQRLSSTTVADLKLHLDAIEKDAEAELARAKAKFKSVRILRSADMRYVGQEHSVTVDLPEMSVDWIAAIKRIFDAVHHERYGHSAPNEEVEIVSLRSTVFGVLDKPPFSELAAGGKEPPASARRKDRLVKMPGHDEPMMCCVYAREELKAGNHISGPALIEEVASTSVVLPSDVASVDKFGNLMIGVGE